VSQKQKGAKAFATAAKVTAKLSSDHMGMKKPAMKEARHEKVHDEARRYVFGSHMAPDAPKQ